MRKRIFLYSFIIARIIISLATSIKRNKKERVKFC